MEIRYSVSALRALRRCDKRALIEQKIDQLATDPQSLARNVKRLQGRAASRLRVQDWRVIYREELELLHVIEVGPRGSIY